MKPPPEDLGDTEDRAECATPSAGGAPRFAAPSALARAGTWVRSCSWWWRATLVVVSLALVGGLLVVAAPWRGLPDGAALRVGDETVDESELGRRVNALEALYGIASPADPAGADRFRRATARAVATAMVIDGEAAARGVVVDDVAARRVLDGLAVERERSDGPGGFVRLLGTIGASERDVLDEVRHRERQRVLQGEVTAAVPPVTEAEVARAYEARRAELVAPEQRSIRNIVVSAREDAEVVLDRARRGEDIGLLAREYSLDPTTRDVGGDLGLVTRAVLERGYGDAAFAASGPGGLFGPVQTTNGWNVGQVVTAVPARPLAYPEVAAQLRADLQEGRARAAWAAWVDDRTRVADVEYAEPFRPVTPTGPGTPPGSPGGGPR